MCFLYLLRKMSSSEGSEMDRLMIDESGDDKAMDSGERGELFLILIDIHYSYLLKYCCRPIYLYPYLFILKQSQVVVRSRMVESQVVVGSRIVESRVVVRKVVADPEVRAAALEVGKQVRYFSY